MLNDEALTAALVGSPAAMTLALWLFKKSLERNLKAIDDNIKKAVDDAAKANQGVQDVSMRIAVHGERFDAVNRLLGELKGETGKLSDRIDGVANHWGQRVEKLEGK